MPAKTTPLMRYLKVQKASDEQILKLLRQAYRDSAPHLASLAGSGVGSTVRAAQVRQAQVALNREMSRLWANVGDQVRADRAKAAAAAADTLLDEMTPVLEAAGLAGSAQATLVASMRAGAARSVEHAVSRVTTTKMPLSERVYHSRVLASGQLDNIITSGIARGVSASELAKEVRGFIRPDTPGGVKYAANRLARTELNNAFHGTQVNEAAKSPMITGLKWNLSGSHPKPDECNEYAQTDNGMGEGVFETGNVPAKPHPNCLCFCTPELPDRDAFIKSFQAGKYDDYLNREYGLPPIAEGMTTKEAVKQYAWGHDQGMPIYGQINDPLRRGVEVVGESKKVMEALDLAFEQATPTARGMTVHRLVTGSVRDDILRSAKYKQPWTEKGFASTTKRLDVLDDFDDGYGLQMRITVPKGSKVLHVDDYTKGDPFAYLQNEWLLPKGSRFKIIDRGVDPKTGRSLVDAELLPPLPARVDPPGFITSSRVMEDGHISALSKQGNSYEYRRELDGSVSRRVQFNGAMKYQPWESVIKGDMDFDWADGVLSRTVSKVTSKPKPVPKPKPTPKATVPQSGGSVADIMQRARDLGFAESKDTKVIALRKKVATARQKAIDLEDSDNYRKANSAWTAYYRQKAELDRLTDIGKMAEDQLDDVLEIGRQLRVEMERVPRPFGRNPTDHRKAAYEKLRDEMNKADGLTPKARKAPKPVSDRRMQQEMESTVRSRTRGITGVGENMRQLSASQQKQVSDALGLYPERWGRKIDEVLDEYEFAFSDRGYQVSGFISISGEATAFSRTAVHEMGHALEGKFPKLRAAESALWRRRAGKNFKFGKRDGANEVLNAANPTPYWYSMRTYSEVAPGPDDFYELFTTIVEDMMFGTRKYADDEMIDFVLGMMACI